ncbi:hypothetical protein CYANOKiyG1_66840 [Okeania sp. KiyG1]|nr:hypothetical protein CYANOKiyG1_66840 [Okeania sp. KiyG1]
MGGWGVWEVWEVWEVWGVWGEIKKYMSSPLPEQDNQTLLKQ